MRAQFSTVFKGCSMQKGFYCEHSFAIQSDISSQLSDCKFWAHLTVVLMSSFPLTDKLSPVLRRNLQWYWDTWFLGCLDLKRQPHSK